LLVAAQWSPGTSLYGDYWVDRPPLLIALFQLADAAGGLVALRLLGTVAVVASVLLAARVGRLMAPVVSQAPLLAAATAAVFLTTPLFDAGEVDGELLAVPIVLAGIVAALEALSATESRAWSWWWVAVGAAAVAAPMVKQNMAEVAVSSAVLLVWLLVRRGPRAAVGALSGLALGIAGTTAALLAWATAHGTTLAGLWDAVVVFRADAARVISSRANEATPHRALGLAVAFLASGAVVLLVAACRPGRRSRPVDPDRLDPRLLAGVVVVTEAVGVVLGGSYWLHYLVGTVPGLVMAVAVAAARRSAPHRWVGLTLTYGAVVAGLSILGLAVRVGTPSSSTLVADYLADHSPPGSSAVVGFGDPAILEQAHLGSPYPELWSLPVCIRDPDLRQLTGPRRPTWVVVSGSSLATWGVDASRAQPVLDREYRLEDTEGDYRVYRLREPSPG
jgi:hypothetical protein